MANTHCVDLESTSNQSLTIADGSQTGLGLTGDFTIEFNVKPEDLPGSGVESAIVSKWNSTGNQRGYIIGLYNNAGTQKLTIVLSSDGSSATFKEVTYTLSTVAWQHVAWVYDASAGSAELFINTVSTATVTGLPTSIYNNTAEFAVGRFSGANYFDGRIDDLRVWSDIRTQAELAANYQKELVGNEANLVLYQKFNNSLLDETSNNNDLTNNNTATFQTDPAFVESLTRRNNLLLLGVS